MKNGAIVAGGAVAPDNYDTRVDWVVYFCEYNISLPPAPRGPWDTTASTPFIPVTNAIEALNRQLRKPLKTKGHFPTRTPPAS